MQVSLDPLMPRPPSPISSHIQRLWPLFHSFRGSCEILGKILCKASGPIGQSRIHGEGYRVFRLGSNETHQNGRWLSEGVTRSSLNTPEERKDLKHLLGA
jgi:hypothetical protein